MLKIDVNSMNKRIERLEMLHFCYYYLYCFDHTFLRSILFEYFHRMNEVLENFVVEFVVEG
jgi:hypothetical protein